MNKGKSGEARERFLWALGEGTDGECLQLAIATAKNRSAGREERTLALASLGHSDGAEARAALKDELKDPDPNVPAAAILAEARPGAGKGAVFRLTPLLRDKSVAVRAAAAAALARVGGEAALPQLFLIFKEKDPVVYTTIAPELAALSGQASAKCSDASCARTIRASDWPPPVRWPLGTTTTRPRCKPPWPARRPPSCNSWPGRPWKKTSGPRRSQRRRTRISRLHSRRYFAGRGDSSPPTGCSPSSTR